MLCISSNKDCFALANSEDLDEMPHSAALHLGFHCLPKKLFRGFPIFKLFNRNTFHSVKEMEK